MAASICSSCGGSIPDGYAFCPLCGNPVVEPAPVALPSLSPGRVILLLVNAVLLITFAALGLLAVVAPPTVGAVPAAPTAILVLTSTLQATADARLTPTTLGTAAPGESPTATAGFAADRDGNPSGTNCDSYPAIPDRDS